MPATTMHFKTADLCDQFAAELQIAELVFRSFGGRRNFSGPVSTIECFEDNSRVREAVGEPGDGRVLVVDGGGSRRCALLGDVLANQAADNGWAGVVINGCVRDAAELAGFELGVLALAAMPRRSDKQGRGLRNVIVEIAGARIHPGDFVYADEDGMIVARRALV
jgi:regulator of ribonuclease activity A